MDVTTSHSREPEFFGSFHEIPKSLLGLREGPKITATSGSTVESHHSTLWKQANRRLDLYTSYSREPYFFSPFKKFQNRCLDWGRGPRSPPRVDHWSHFSSEHFGSKRTEDWTSQPATAESLRFFCSFHEIQKSLLGWEKTPKITTTSKSSVAFQK